MIDHKTFREIVECEDPVETIWKILSDIWSKGAESLLQGKSTVKEYYAQCEATSDMTERVLLKAFFDFYGYLLDLTGKRKLLRNRFPSDVNTALIMDSMSLREAAVIVKELEKRGFDIQEFTYDASASPSETEAYRFKNLGVKTFQELLHKKKLGFKPLSVMKEADIDELEPSDESMLIWSAFPDILLQGSSLNYESIHSKTEEVLFKTLDVLKPHKVIIASDHGYVADVGTWGMPSEHVKVFQKVFKTHRFKKLSEIDSETLNWIMGLPRDSSYFIHDNERIYVRGRYMWTTKGRRPVSFHGGISVLEVLCPFIVAQRG